MSSEKTLEECLPPETLALIDRIVEESKTPPGASVLEVEDLVDETDVDVPPGVPRAPSFKTVCRHGWVKERHPWGIRVDFRPCSQGGMTDIFAINLVSIQEVGWRGCSSGGSWHKSIICYRS